MQIKYAGKKAVVLLSGGMDSATVLFMAGAMGFKIYALTFDYGQKNLFEIPASEKLASLAGAAEHRVMKIDLGSFGGSDLTSGGGFQRPGGVPPTYVPGRNTVFLAVALSWAEAGGADSVFYGANSVDFGGYPDCTEEYVEAFNNLAKVGLSSPVRIEAPLLNMTKTEIVKIGISLGIDYSLTNSCYFPGSSGAHCGSCQSCLIRMRALEEVEDEKNP